MRPCLKRIQPMANVPLAYVSVFQRMSDILHTLAYASTIRNSVTGPLRSGYHQLTLSMDSRYITTFATHKGLHRYTRLNFGTNSASEIFQNVIHDQIKHIPGALNISDDVIIYRKSQNEHDSALHAVCQRFLEIGLTLNDEKCLFDQNKLTFFDLVFSSDGISADPAKVSAIKNAPAPRCAKDIRSFLGMATYCAKFIPNFSNLTEPLRKLTVKNAHFRWTNDEECAFNNVIPWLTRFLLFQQGRLITYFPHYPCIRFCLLNFPGKFS